MKLETKYALFRKAALFGGFAMLLELASPAITYALTSGPTQPEFASFEPVATTNMVNEFTGGFTYNLPLLEIPGAHGGGYTMSLSYHSGASPEEEASWVGYGWTLNPGSILRSKRGFPDDQKGAQVDYWNKAPTNWTASVGGELSFEGWSTDVPANVNASIRYNNYKGFGYTAGAGISLARGVVSLGFGITDGEGSFSAAINPAQALTAFPDYEKKSEEKPVKAASTKLDWKTAKQRGGARLKQAGVAAGMAASRALTQMTGDFLGGSQYGMTTHGSIIRPSNVMEYKGQAFNINAGLLGALTPAQLGASLNVFGSFSQQHNLENDPLDAYGYLYSGYAGSDDMMDFYRERETPYHKNDHYLPMPVHEADNFMMSGEAIGGTFRFYSRKPGHYRANHKRNRQDIFDLGLEFEAGLNIGGGARIGVGFQRLHVYEWDSGGTGNIDNYRFPLPNAGDEAFVPRFDADLGGKLLQSPDDKVAQANISSKAPVISLGQIHATNHGQRSGRSSYIAWHTNAEMEEESNGRRVRAYTRDEAVHNFINRGADAVEDGIGEFAVTNEDGTCYQYGLPVYSRNEGNFIYDLQGVPGTDIHSNYLAYRDITTDLKIKAGEERPHPYASMFLLTGITTPDYVDRTLDGPTPDDFGGYTRFVYNRAYGSNSKTADTWYRWRTPYTGLLYDRGEMSDPTDATGSVTYGEKEVYYLDTIETTTHFAVFHTSNREDGYGAPENEDAAKNDNGDFTQPLQRLDSIRLFAKPDNQQSPHLLQTVRFEYDYSLCSGVPNNTNGSNGKLTLKKVWFEYEGVYNAKITPYEFEYAYPDYTALLPADLQSKYSDIVDFDMWTDAQENPGYSFFNLDNWGNYQANGATRHARMQNWVSQSPPTSFDPAAWQLKNIKLPSGGEIHVQYEQHDYHYVQDQPAMAMVSLSTADVDASEFKLNLGDLDPGENATKIRDMIQDEFVNKGRKMYFKFLYRLLGSSTPAISDCNVEYITGYADVVSTWVSNGVWVKLGQPTLDYGMPQQVCRDYVQKERAGKTVLTNDCTGDDGVANNGDPLDVVLSFLTWIANLALSTAGEQCKAINPELSYLKVPLHQPKKGGGVRVKRLLMYDEGLETDDAVLLGNEYIYEAFDDRRELWTSSGVALNEPMGVRDDHSLVQFIERDGQGIIDRIIAGPDKKQMEGILGESLLPGPSVGYSRVVTRNIHTGRTHPGFEIREFHTAKDYPFKAESTNISEKKFWLPLLAGIVNIIINHVWLSQGYAFTDNQMNGQMKRMARYGGKAGDYNDPDARALSFEQQLRYYEPGEFVPIMKDVNTIDRDQPGRVTESWFEARAVDDIADDYALEFDVDVGLLGFIPVPFATGMPYVNYTDSRMHSHVTVKHTAYPVVQKEVITYQDGIYDRQQNVAFDPQSMEPRLTRSWDGFDDLDLALSANHSGAYHTYNFPAAHVYEEMGQRAFNERYRSDATGMIITNNGETFEPGVQNINKLSAGDLLRLYEGNNAWHYHVDQVDDVIVHTLPSGFFASSASTYTVDSFEVIRSGRTNQLKASAGSLTTYGGELAEENTIPQDNIAERQRLVDTLNHYLTNMNDYISLQDEWDLQVDVPNIGCRDVDRVTMTITVIRDHLRNPVSVSIVVNMLRILNGIPHDCISTFNTLLADIGYFALDQNFQLIYVNNAGEIFNFNLKCLLCSSEVKTFDKVLDVNMRTFKHDWPYDESIWVPHAGANAYEKGARGKWRLHEQYVYDTTTIGGADIAANERIYKDAGVFDHFEMFNWHVKLANDLDHWLKLNTITAYAPHGEPVEEQNILGIHSTAKFGYHGTMPYLVAQNADYNSVQFESFENVYTVSSNQFLEDGLAFTQTGKRTDAVAHSGRFSLLLDNPFALKDMTLTTQIQNNGLSVQLWLKTNGNPIQAHRLVANYDNNTQPFAEVAMAGDWTLYEAILTDFSGIIPLLSTFSLEVAYNPAGSEKVWIDDVRVQPVDAEMTAYVYDRNTLRLHASFDDRHFGLYYQYNAEGDLVRQLKETERGTVTVQEQQRYTVEENR